jgi:gliding motility-associated-like protein
MKKFLSLLVFLFCAFSAFSQLSKKHYIPPLTSSDGFTDQYIYISTPKANNVSYKITPIGNPDITAYSGVVSNANPVEQPVLNSAGFNDFDDNTQLHINRFNINSVINNKGFIIEANDVIYVSIRVRSALSGGDKFHAGALVSKGSSALGNEFRIGGLVRGSTPVNGHITFASLMATEDNTIVNITNIPSGFVQPNGSSIPTDIILNEGESFILASQTTAGFESKDIIGGLISSDKPIVVNSGSATGSFGNNDGRDYGFDQIVGADRIGSEYILVRGAGNNDWENALVIAHENNTEVSVNGRSIATLNAGEYVVVEGNSYNTNGNMYINSSLPVFVYQGIGGQSGSEANQGLFFVPPLSCENKGNVDNIAGIDKIGTADFPGGVTIVTNKGANVLINGLDISTYSPQGPSDVTGNPNYVTYKVSGLSRNIKVEGDQELYCAYFNANGFAASGAFYSGFPSAPEINFNTEVASSGICIPNVTLQAANTDLFDSFEWQFFNPASSSWEQRSTTANYKPLESEPGRYRLIGTINCTGANFFSVEIIVSICPDDYDSDLIIDNLDVDLDNDGILNSDESLGDGTINLTNLTNPTVEADGVIVPNLLTGNLTSEGDVSFIGSTNGKFTSTIKDNSTANAKNIYVLSSSETFNFEFTQDASQPHTLISGVEYQIKIGPAAKNVTLIDPDNVLLVDTNFDGEFETDVDNYSSSVIRFVYNPSPEGNNPFKFVANDVDEVIFLHTATSNVTNSIFNGSIKLTNVRMDSDGDGIEDALDLDSDNDGVPDLFEAANQSITLLNTDNDLNGLDDVFDSVTLVIDTDGDGVPNHLDLDSDNDGIYDLVESGFTLSDTDTNGIIDNANAANVGINGLLDSLESTPDSGILANPLRNSDSTSVVTENQDTIYDFADLDADGDGCDDVVEAGFTGNGAGRLEPHPNVDLDGKVNNSDGYTTPNADYITSAPIIINSFADPVFCELNTDVITIDSNADTFQWQVSTDGATWNSLDDTRYDLVTPNELQITDTPLSFNNNQYRVILTKAGNNCSKISNPVILTVNPLPVIKNNPSEINQCIDESDTNPSVNLTTSEGNISETPNITFEYFTDIYGKDQITNPTSYPVTVNTIEVVYVSVISDEGCSNGLVELRINVGQTPDNPYNDVQPPVCNDTPGANDDTVFTANFSLDIDAILNSINPPAKTKVFFYENSSDRNNSLYNIDITNYRNDIDKIDSTTIPEGIQFPIYYKIISTINNDCQGLGEFFLQIHAVPQANTVPDIEECDNEFADGINTSINLRDYEQDILGGEQYDAGYYNVTFHETKNGAMNISDEVIENDTNYTNVPNSYSPGTQSEQTIFVRVENNVTTCFNANTSFKIIIHPIPTIPATVPDLIISDVATSSDSDARNRIAQNIDLTRIESEILMGRPNLSIEYYIKQQDAENRETANAIINPSDYQNSSDPSITLFPTNFSNDDPAIQTIFYVVVDETGLECNSLVSTFRLLVYPEPFVNPISIYSDCDNDDDGCIQIDLTEKAREILGDDRYNRGNYNVSFYLSDIEAKAGLDSNALPYLYRNCENNEIIYVRVENEISDSIINANESFEVKIYSLPNYTVTKSQIICLKDIPLNLFVNDFGNVYSYRWLDNENNVLGTEDNLDVYTAGTYKVIATDNITLCERKETIVVNPSDVAILDPNFVTIIDESNNLGSTNNLSISIDTINNDLGPGDYQFAIINTKSGIRIPSTGYQDEPLFENLEGGIYEVIANDKNGCSPNTTLTVSVIQFPKFFTPNGDNINDTWVVKGANKTFYPNASINIFNRFGNLVAQVPIDSNGWDGTYQGKILPSDDYWYNVTLVPADTSKPTINKKGNFSLLRK